MASNPQPVQPEQVDHPGHRKPVSHHSPIQDKSNSPIPGPLPASGTFSFPFSADAQKTHQRHASEPQNAPYPKMMLLQKLAAPQPQQPPRLPQSSPPSSSPLVSTPPPGSGFQFTETQPSPKLTKQQPPSPNIHRQRSISLQSESQQHHGPVLRYPSPSAELRGRSSSAHAPGNNLGHAAVAAGSRPVSSNDSQSPGREKRGRLRRSWLPGGRSRSNSQDIRGKPSTAAWILDETKADYNTAFLAAGDKVPELWAESGNVLVYLHPRGSGLGPSFKVPSFVVDTSLGLADLIAAEEASPSSSGRPRTRSFTGRDNLSVDDVASPFQSPSFSGSQTPGETKLYIPVALSGPTHPGTAPQPDLERMISIRNLFAFLTGQPLVGTRAQPTLFSVFIRLSSLLAEFQFTNSDGSTFGEAVELSFGFYMEKMALADVRHSREKTLESLVLGERMRSWELYNEAFAHAVGKYMAIRDLKSPLWDQMNPQTRQKLERAHLELLNRQNSVNNNLESFEFPSLFSGTASSTSVAEYKNVKYGTWKKSFSRMRHFVLGYYKSNLGSWPPKARSKKNPFSESGLNRQVLKILYSDLCALYDLLVDRESITPRVNDQNEDDVPKDVVQRHLSALRKILGEFDRSSPPVLPPIPFDVPKLPDMTSVKENYYSLPPKEQARLDRNLQENEFLLIMNKSYDFETSKLKMPFLEEFKEFEMKEAKGKTASEMADQRIGYWLFLYVVIQSLPMLVVDAPGLKFTEGVEYFLCSPPKGSAPWMGDAPELRKKWYEVSGGAGYVELDADAVEFSIEGIYHRSHCWLAAKQWEADALAPLPMEDFPLSPLQAPESVFANMDLGGPASPSRSESPPSGGASPLALKPRTGSPARRAGYRSSIVMGLEEVPMPGYADHNRGSRVVSARDSVVPSRPVSAMLRSVSSGNVPGPVGSPDSTASSRQVPQGTQSGSTFDDILKDVEKKPKKKKSSRFFG